MTDKTTVTKAGSPATFADIAADEAVTGLYWKQNDDSLECKTVKLGAARSGDGATSSRKGKKSDASSTAASPAASASPSASPKK